MTKAKVQVAVDRAPVSDIGLRTPAGLREVEAAHVVPVSEGGTDDLRNGIALTQTLHWAFDRGLFGIRPGKREIYVPPQVLAQAGNAYLKDFQGCRVARFGKQAPRISRCTTMLSTGI